VHPNWLEWVFGKREEHIEHFTPENWKAVAIGLDNWSQMGVYALFTDKYMQEAEQAGRSATVAGRLPPKRPLAQ